VENLTKSSEQVESQPQSNVMELVKSLYRRREVMPMEAEPNEKDVNLNTEE
jgi:hypothetical protein